jgi:predicted nucleic acid-binding Zn ribbon protein
MVTLEEQIGFIETRICLEKDKSIIYTAILETLHKSKCNAMPLHLDRKRCPSCGKSFDVKNKLQECCSANCRVNLHRSKRRLEKFNKQVEQILKEENSDAKFIIEQKISDSRNCPFVVYYDENKYESESTRNLLTQLRNI